MLKVAKNYEPQSFDPSIRPELADTVYEALVRFDGKASGLVGVLAESVEWTPDAREWSFKLKSGITFHDGEPFTSTAAKISFDYYLDSPGEVSTLIPTKTHVDDSDPMVLRVTTPTPYPDLGRFLSAVHIISPKLVKAGQRAVQKRPTGTGPFKFLGYRTSDSIIMEANPRYWGPGPYLERLEFPIIPDADSRLAALRSGGVHLVQQVPPANAASLRERSDLVVIETPQWSVGYIFIFTETPPFNNVKVRQALAHSIDREALVKFVLDGHGTTDDSWAPPGVYGHHGPTTSNPYDPNRAEQLLAESGLPVPVNANLGIAMEAVAVDGRLAHAVAGMAKKVGINLAVKPVPAAQAGKGFTLPPDRNRPWSAYLGGEGFFEGTAAHMPIAHILENYLQVSDPTYTQLAEKVLTTADGPQRLRLFAEIEQRVAEIVPVIKLYNAVQIDVHSAKVRGLAVSSSNGLANFGATYLAG